jgi:hypothetical protein
METTTAVFGWDMPCEQSFFAAVMWKCISGLPDFNMPEKILLIACAVVKCGKRSSTCKNPPLRYNRGYHQPTKVF